MILSNKPYKGTIDLYGVDMKILQYIFTVWREVCQSYNYQEYLTPLLESAKIYNKSGEDAGSKELCVLEDRGGRKLAIRPEMTPSVTRLVSRIYKQSPKPLRLFSIANFMRFEKPQRGRNREFWQLNLDIFGEQSLGADLEIISLAIDLMLSFFTKVSHKLQPADCFEIRINSRQLIDYFLDQIVQISSKQKVAIIRIMDKFVKLKLIDFKINLQENSLTEKQIKDITAFMTADINFMKTKWPKLAKCIGFKQIEELLQKLQVIKKHQYVKFMPGLMRGLDYYDGVIYEVFDKHPDNNRSMFGGGRYNGLAELFGSTNLPAVGVAPGNVTTQLFLESWGLIPSINDQINIFIPQLMSNKLAIYTQLVKDLRHLNLASELSLDVINLKKSLQYANSHCFKYVVLLGTKEETQQIVTIKNMDSGEQKAIPPHKLADYFTKTNATLLS